MLTTAYSDERQGPVRCPERIDAESAGVNGESAKGLPPEFCIRNSESLFVVDRRVPDPAPPCDRGQCSALSGVFRETPRQSVFVERHAVLMVTNAPGLQSAPTRPAQSAYLARSRSNRSCRSIAGVNSSPKSSASYSSRSSSSTSPSPSSAGHFVAQASASSRDATWMIV